eukprot:GGOE01058456.1.p1 GENE.GGOE01058456.1~~GGOE01058456.1.p1  ORF type:complete len:470 (+),score=79.44 GGOE01058456.1:29-1411(+)
MATEMPERYLCPITTEIMMDPVMDHHGHNFERSAITEWLGRSEECPFSREAIQLGALSPNLALKEEISEWLAHSHPMFSFTGLVSTSSSASSLGEPMSFPTSPEDQPNAMAPWEKLDVDQNYYDHLMALFLSFGCGEANKSKLQDLCCYMNFASALGHLDELLPRESIPPPRMTFEDFLTFVQKHQPNPVAEYGLNELEYNSILRKFQALDQANLGKVSRKAILTLVEKMKVDLSEAELEESLPQEDVTLHEFLLRCKRCRLLVARRSSVLSPPLVLRRNGMDIRPLAIDGQRSPPMRSPRITPAIGCCSVPHPRGSFRVRQTETEGLTGSRSPRCRPLCISSNTMQLSAARHSPRNETSPSSKTTSKSSHPTCGIPQSLSDQGLSGRLKQDSELNVSPSRLNFHRQAKDSARQSLNSAAKHTPCTTPRSTHPSARASPSRHGKEDTDVVEPPIAARITK